MVKSHSPRAAPAAFLLAALTAAGALAAQPATLATSAATYQTVPREYRLDGVVEAVNRTTVSAQTQGRVDAILFDVDDFVNKGDVVARLRDTEHQAKVVQAAAELKSASATLEQAREEFTRVEGLFRNKNVSASAMDQAQAELTGAQARLEAAQAGLEQAREQLDYTQIRAPYSGIVTQRHVEVGEVVGPGQPVMSGVSLEELRVIVDVPQSLIGAVRGIGQVNIHLPDGAVARSGKITIFPFADPGSNTFKVRLDLDANADGLFPGMFVKTGIVTGERRELTVPKAAVVYRSEVTGVYVVGADGHIGLRQILTGRQLGDRVAVLSGLSDGEQVALDPLAAGVALKAQAVGVASHD